MQRCQHSHNNMSGRVYVAAASIETLRELIALQLACDARGETVPAQVDTCIGLIKGGFGKAYPEITSEEAIIASQVLH